MFKNYFKIAWRNLWKNKLFSFINITGLAVGVTCCILIFMYVQSELSFDTHWNDADRIVRVNQIFSIGNEQPDPYAITAFGVGPALKQAYPEIEEAIRIDEWGTQTVWYEDKKFDIDHQYFADAEIFDVFNFELIKGNPITCLIEPHAIVISETVAKKFFNTADPMGKMLKYGDRLCKITGILKEPKEQSRLKPNTLISLSSYGTKKTKEMLENWFGVGSSTFLKLKEGTSLKGFNKKLHQWSQKVLLPAAKAEGLVDVVELKAIALSDVYFDKVYKYDQFKKGEKSYIYIFGWVAVFVLLIACFNYMNLSTARAVKRAKEVGLRKVVGASRKQLIAQFLSESAILSFSALLFSLILLILLLPSFNAITEKSISLSSTFNNTGFWLAIIAIMLFISFVGGSYPAFYLSNFQPATVLKGKLIELKSISFFGKLKLRQVLVVMQFAISIIIIIATILVFDQLTFMKNKDLGFNKDQVVVLNYPSEDSLVNKNMQNIKNDFLSDPSITKFATTEQVIGSASRLGFFVKDGGKVNQTVLNLSAGDYDFLDILDIKIIQGRGFSKDLKSDTANFILNETAVKFLKLKDPIGTELNLEPKDYGKVIGVVKDFNYKSPHSVIEPLAIVLPRTSNMVGSKILLKLDGKNINESISIIEQKWKQYFPQYPVRYFFLDDEFNKQYHKDDTMLTIFSCFSGLTILISCLGLFGLASFTTEQRTKEIGIRKVLGASVSNITYLISKDFILLVLIGISIASPIAYYALTKWLQNYAYHTNLSVGIFVIAGCLALLVAFLTVSSQAIKAAFTNPTKSLRTE